MSSFQNHYENGFTPGCVWLCMVVFTICRDESCCLEEMFALQRSLKCFVFSFCSKAGIGEVFEGHQGPVTGINCHMAVGPIDFSHLFVTSSFDWTVKLWTTKVRMP